MNVKSLFTVAALAAATFAAHAAQADEYTLNLNYPAPVAAVQAPRIVERVAQVDEYQRNQTPTTSGVQVLQRAQVSAEAREARKLGLIAEGELGEPVATAAQIAQVHQAGLAAVQAHVAAK